MRFSSHKWILLCGLLLGLAAFPVFGQENEAPKIKLNRRPLYDMGVYVGEILGKKEVDLSAPYSVSFSGTLDAGGKIEPATAKFVTISGDARMMEVVRKGIWAANDSGFLQYFSHLGIKTLNISIEQDDANFSAAVLSEAVSLKEARKLKSAFSTSFSMAKMLLQTESGDKEILELINNVTVKAEGKWVVVKMTAPKSVIQRFIQNHVTMALERRAMEIRN